LKVGKSIPALLALCLVLPRVLGAEKPPRVRLPGEFARLGYRQIELQRTGEKHLYVVGKLNGRRRSVLVDTGWSFTTISTNAARKLSVAVAVGTNAHPTVLITDLKLGSASFTNQPARVEHMVFDGQPASFDVVLGCDFLQRSFALVDCLNRRLYTRGRAPSEVEQSQLEAALSADGFVAIPLNVKQPLAITCPARVNGQPVEMLVDTGAVWSVIDVRQLDRLGLRALPTLAKISGAGKTGTRAVAMAEVKSLSVGDLLVTDVNVAVIDLSDWGFAAPGKGLSEIQGILGGVELLANGALIDCGGLKLWMKRSSRKK